MSYADVKDRLVVHVQTAGAALTPPLEDVQAAFPLPKGRCARIYYGGETDPRRMGGRYTQNSEMVGKVTMIAAFWPITALDEEQARIIDAEAEAFGHALRTAVDTDSDLAGAGDNTTLGDATPDIFIVGTTRFLGVVWEAVTDYAEYALSK
jgi:hypothetical protein